MLERLLVVLLLAILAGCATGAGEVKPAPGAPRVMAKVEPETLSLQLRIGDLENELAEKAQQIAELTELLVAAELARTDHLAGAARSGR